MWYLTLILWGPTLAVLLGVLFVNFFIPIKTRLDHSLATTISAGVVWAVWGVIEQRELVFVGLVGFVFVVFIADFISTFISFTDRTRNAIVTVIVFVPVYLAVAFGFGLLLAQFIYMGPR
jgi:hypothetical protein